MGDPEIGKWVFGCVVIFAFLSLSFLMGMSFGRMEMWREAFLLGLAEQREETWCWKAEPKE